MKTIIKKGTEKTFRMVCPICATEFTYQYEDTEKSYDRVYNPYSLVKCAWCNEGIKVDFEEYGG